MYAIRASIDDDRADVVCRAIAEAAVPRTTTVSGAYLRAGASGAAVAAWHALAGALIDDRPQAIDLAALRLTRLGHTSGADALAGFVLAGRRLAEAR
jgi:hypothetical protein